MKISRDIVGWFFKDDYGDFLGIGPFATREEAKCDALDNATIRKCGKFIMEARKPKAFDFNDVPGIGDILYYYAKGVNNPDDSYAPEVYPHIDETVEGANEFNEKLRKLIDKSVRKHGLWAWGGKWENPHETYEFPIKKQTVVKEVTKEVETTEYTTGKAIKIGD